MCHDARESTPSCYGEYNWQYGDGRQLQAEQRSSNVSTRSDERRRPPTCRHRHRRNVHMARPSETLTETSWCAGALAANSTDETITSMPSRNRTAATSAFPRAEHNPSEKEGIGSLPGPRGAGRRRCRRCTRRWG